ncbi:WSC-domain-containing protein [Phlegmacium glaucopus]|nr:WSC-domain-containing protein [Phlegmacium glaucopus]
MISKKSLLAAFAGAALFSVHASPVIDARQSESLPAGWSSIGCYSDTPASRTLRIASFTSVSNMTIESCLAFCTPGEYIFAGVEFARECYCDNVIESTGAPISSSSCNMPCTGNPDEICGGSNAINIFQNSAATGIPPPPPPPPSTGTIVQTAGTYQYQGCYQDAVNGAPRSLQHQLTVSGGVTAESCTSACKASGFVIAGLEFGQECWCDTYMALAVLTPDTDCAMTCVANDMELCGAGNRLAIYVDSTAPPITLSACLGLGNPFNFDLVAVFVPPSPGAQVSAPVQLGSIELPAHPGQASTLVLGTRLSNDPHVYSIGGEGLSSIQELSFNGFFSAVSIQPLAGGNQFFQIPGTGPSPVPFTQYCPQPNPLSPSTYIGPPVLGVDGQTNVWGFCAGSLVYLPSSGCSAVLLAMTQAMV